MSNVLNVSYSVWKQVLNSNSKFQTYYLDHGKNYTVVFGHRDLIYLAYAYGEDKTDFTSFYVSNSLLVDSLEDAQALILLDANVKSEPRNEFGILKVQAEHHQGDKLELFSQNFCDKRTWFVSSTRVSGASMTDAGDGYTFKISDGYKIIVDVNNGRISEGFKLNSEYSEKVYVDGILMNRHNPDSFLHYDSDGKEVHDFANGDEDYGCDYLTGNIVFKEYQGGKTVTIDYSEVSNSKWYIKPDTNKRIELLSAELQFSKDAVMRSDVIIQPRGDVGKHPLLAPCLDSTSNPARSALSSSFTWDGTTTVTTLDTSEISVGEYISPDGYGTYYYVGAVVPNTSVVIVDVLNIGFIPSGTLPSVKSSIALFPAGTMLPLGDPTRYATKFDIIAEANLSYPIIPADIQLPEGGWTWRQAPKDITIYRWDYKDQAYIDVRSSWGMDIEISLGDDVPADGWKAVVTFYGISQDEDI